ncbi:MAG TPA: capsule biosynthesis protein [Methylovirgula sp.]
MAWQNLNAFGGFSRFWSKAAVRRVIGGLAARSLASRSPAARSPAAGNHAAGSPAAIAIAAGHRRTLLVRLVFLAIVVIPTGFSALYYAFFASPGYVSEAQFLVRGVSSARVGGLNTLFQTFGISRAVDESNVVESYILSRDAVKALVARLPLRAMFSRPEGDLLSRFPRFWEHDNFESLYRYYLQHVTVVDDTAKGISTLRVVTFRSADSVKIAAALISLAEEVSNRLNLRAQKDTVSAAQRDVDIAEAKVIAAQAKLTAFRNGSLLVDPSKESDSELKTVSSLWLELTQTLAEIHEASITSPSNPALPVWRAKVDALRGRIAAERGNVTGNDESLGTKVSQYEGLTLARDLADKSLAAAIDSLELARQEARRQQIYIEKIAGPNTPDEAAEPQRLRLIATIFMLTFSVFSVLRRAGLGAKTFLKDGLNLFSSPQARLALN